MKVVNFGDVPSHDWNVLCDSSDEGWLFLRSEWLQLESGRLNADNHSFGIELGGQLVAIVGLLSSDLPVGPFVERLVHTGVHRHTGFAFSNAMAPVELAEVQRFALTRCLEIATRLKADRVQLSVQNASPAWRPGGRCDLPFWASSGSVHYGLFYGPNGVTPAPQMSTLAIDQFYDLSIDPHLPGIGVASTARTAYRKAMGSGFRVEEIGPELRLSAILDLSTKSAARTGEVLPACTYFRQLISAAPHRGQVTVIAAVDSSDSLAGALIVAHDKGVVHFLHAYSDPGHLQSRVNDLLHLSAIEWARQAGFAFYRLGPYFPEVPQEWPIARVSKFKTKYANRHVAIRQGSVFINHHKYADTMKVAASLWS